MRKIHLFMILMYNSMYNFFHLFIIFIYIYTFFDLFALLATRSQHYRRGLSKSMQSVLSEVFFFPSIIPLTKVFAKEKRYVKSNAIPISN